MLEPIVINVMVFRYDKGIGLALVRMQTGRGITL